MNPLVQVLAILIVCLVAFDGWRRGGAFQAVIQAIGAVVVVIVVILLLRALGVALP